MTDFPTARNTIVYCARLSTAFYLVIVVNTGLQEEHLYDHPMLSDVFNCKFHLKFHLNFFLAECLELADVIYLSFFVKDASVLDEILSLACVPSGCTLVKQGDKVLSFVLSLSCFLHVYAK